MRALARTTVALSGWLACVVGAAQAAPLAGPAVVAAILLGHAFTLRNPPRELRPVLVTAIVGTLLESTWIAAGAYLPREAMRGTPFCPIWITALWVNAAVWLQGVAVGDRARPPGRLGGESPRDVATGPVIAGAALAGAIAIPASYAGAAALDALSVAWPWDRAAIVAACYGAVAAAAALGLMRASRTQLD